MAAQYELLKELLNSGTKLSFEQDFFFKFYQAFLLKDRWMQYISGVGTTLLVTALALALGVVLGSVGSAAGRLLMPLLSDKIGRRPTDLLLFAASFVLSGVFLFAQGWAVAAVYASLTFCYSALAAVLPALSTDLFGLPHAGVNYGFLALGQSVGSYTVEQFKAEYPQFCDAAGKCHLPDALLEEIVKMANVSIQPDKWLDSWHYAVGLYVAHYVTLQLRTYAESTATPAQAAASGALVGVVKSATLGDSSVTYDTSALTAGTEDWGDLNATTYGQMLANRARFIGAAGTFVM